MANNGPILCHDTETTATQARDHKVQRAREVLADAGWLFDDFVNNEMRRVLTSDPDDMTTREIAYNRARVATEVKAGLRAWSMNTRPTPSSKERREQPEGEPLWPPKLTPALPTPPSTCATPLRLMTDAEATMTPEQEAR